MRWPFRVVWPDPHAADNLVAALLGSALFPSLWTRSIDGMLEPKAAFGAPKEVDGGIRVDLAAGYRPSDIVSCLTRAKSGGAALALRDLPVPRVDGARGVLFPGLKDIDGLIHKLASPLCGIARVEPRRLRPAGAYDVTLETRGETSTLKVTRRPVAPAPGKARAQRPLEGLVLDGPVELAQSFRSFERQDAEIGWLSDGLFQPRPASRTFDLGALAFIALRAGGEVPELSRPGAALAIVDNLDGDRMAHLGLLRRGHAAAPSSLVAPSDPAKLAANVPILVRASEPILVAAAEMLAQDLGSETRKLDDASFERARLDGRYPLMLDVVRAFDESALGAAMALATFDRQTEPPKAGMTARDVAERGSAAIGWELSLVGAQAREVWIPRAGFGGFDLDSSALW